MLKFNLATALDILAINLDLNTSYVKVQLEYISFHTRLLQNLNTSYVKVQL